MECSSVIEVNASPEAVWDVLTNFEHYARWTKAVRMAGKPVVDDPVVYTLMVRTRFNPNFPFRVDGAFKIVERPTRLEWSIGVPGLLAFRVGYELTAMEDRVWLKHYAHISGVAAPLGRGRFARLISPFLDIVTKDVARRIPKGAAKPQKSNRRARRKAQHSR